jgi:hypothetical protein
MENKYTADDLAEAILNLEHEVTYTEYKDFVDATTEKWNVINNKTIYGLLDYLGAEKFLDAYNEHLKNFKNTLHVGDVYINTRKASICYNHKVIITEYDKANDIYYALYDDGEYIKTTNESFNFDCYEKIGSIDTKTFVHSKNDLINKANEL